MTGWLVILRPLFMWAAARLARAAQPAIAFRWALVAAAGHPLTTLTGTLWAWAAAAGPVQTHQALLITALVLAIEKALGLMTDPFRLWQLAWSTKRRWPVQYTVVDNSTQDVQASFGGAGTAFLASSRKLTRPVMGHPALSLLPKIDWTEQTATWGIHANAGQTLPALENAAPALSSRFPYVHRVDIDYPNPQASIGAICFWYAPEDDPLDGTESSDLGQPAFGAPDDGLGDYDGSVNW